MSCVMVLVMFGYVMKYTHISIHIYIYSQQHTATYCTMNHVPYIGSRHILRGAFHHKDKADGSGVGGGVWGGGGGLKGVVKKEQFGVSRVNCIDCLDRTNVVQVCCSVLQCVAVCCSVLQYVAVVWIVSAALWNCVFTHTHARKRANTQTVASLPPQHTTTHCNTQPYNATHWNTLQHTTTYCNTQTSTEFSLSISATHKSTQTLSLSHVPVFRLYTCTYWVPVFFPVICTWIIYRFEMMCCG